MTTHASAESAWDGAFALPHVRVPAREGRPAAGVMRSTTPWSFKLLLLFLLLLMTNASLLVPALATLAPAQGVGYAALALLLLEITLTGGTIRLAWPESHLLIAFVGAAALSTFTALWMGYAVQQTTLLLKFVAIYLLLVNTVDSVRRLRLTMAVLAVGGLFPALGALWHVHQGLLVEGSRAAWIGIFGNPNDLAYALAVLLPLLVATALTARGPWKPLLWAGTIAYAAAVFLSYSRGGLLAFAVAALLCLWRFGGTPARLVGLALVIVALVLVPAHWSRSQTFNGLSQDTTVNQRLATMRAGLAMFADRPLLGVGLGCSILGFPLYAAAGDVGGGWLVTHNTPIQLLAETGALGTIPFVLAVAAALAAARRVSRRWRALGRRDAHVLVSALGIALVAFLVAGLSGGELLTWFPYLVLGLISAAQLMAAPPAPGAAA